MCNYHNIITKRSALLKQTEILIFLFLSFFLGLGEVIDPVDQRGGDDHLWEWWHTVLIVCIAVVVLLGIVVAILTVVS